MTTARTHSGLRLGLTVAVAGCVLVPAAQAATQPLPAAGWHGREIRDPRNDARRVVAPQRPASVAEAQRLLRRLGYEPGPVDGVLGPRTRSSVQWFQIKHGLAPAGRLDDATVAHLRLRVRTGGPVPGTRPIAAKPPPAAGPATSPPGRALPALRRTPQAPAAADDGPPIPLLALLGILGAALATLTMATSRRRRRARPAHPPRPAAAGRASPPPVVAAGGNRVAADGHGAPAPAEPKVAAVAQPEVTAVGYARGRDRTDLDRHSAAIRRACSERGWTLDRLVREGGAGPRRPGLVHALRHVADGAAARLVVDEVEHLGSTPAELASRLAWCSRNHVDVVVLDVGLDTGTREGRVAARCLLAIAGSDRPAPLRRAGNGRAGAATGAPARAAGAAHGTGAEP